MQINANKPSLWKADVEKSIDFYNDWFLRFAPETYRTQRKLTTKEVTQALSHTDFLRTVTPEALIENPGVLSMLRMVCAPPIARDRLIGLAHVSKNLVVSMEGKSGHPPRIPPRMDKVELNEYLVRICETIEELADRDLFGWLETGRKPTKKNIARASIVVADRLCGATADPIIRNAQECRQLKSIRQWLELRGYKYIPAKDIKSAKELPAGHFTFRLNIVVGKTKKTINIPVDCVIQPKNSQKGNMPILIEAKSAGDATNTNKRRKEEAQKYNQLKNKYGRNVQFVLFLCGYFEPGYLGYEASEGIDWIWEHRINDLAMLLHEPDIMSVKEECTGYAGEIESREQERFVYQAKIDEQRTQTERNILGQFSTPFELARDITKETLLLHDFSDISFLEPALGAGVFFSALQACLGGKYLKNAVGVEIDSAYSSLADKLWPDAPFQVVNQDFIKFSQELENHKKFNLLCANPPYVRHHHIPSMFKPVLQNSVQAALGLRPNGLSGLYIYFLLLSHNLLAPNAVASWLIPSEFLSVNYGKILREYLVKHVTLLRIHQFDPEDVQFDDALVSSCVVTYKNQEPLNPYKFTFSYGGSLSEPKLKREQKSNGIDPSQKWIFKETSPEITASANGHTLSDLFDVRRGIATGANRFFIVDREIANKYEIPSCFLKPILPSPRYIHETVIEADSTGFPTIPKAQYLLDCTLPPDVVKKEYPLLWKYLESGQAEGVADKYICSNRKFWYLQERRDPALFMITYMGRCRSTEDNPFRFFLNLSSAVATNVFLMLYPKPHVLELLAANRKRMLELLQCLNGLTKQVLVNGGRSYGGGLHKMEPRELLNLPLCKFPNWLTFDIQGEFSYT